MKKLNKHKALRDCIAYTVKNFRKGYKEARNSMTTSFHHCKSTLNHAYMYGYSAGVQDNLKSKV